MSTLRVSYILIGGMFVLFLFFAFYGLVIFGLSIDEIKNLQSTRNEESAFRMMQDLDQKLENRISNLAELTKMPELQEALIRSNIEFQNIPNVKIYLAEKELQIQVGSGSNNQEILDEELSRTLKEKLRFYKEEYGVDVIEEFFVTNAFGANVALGTGQSDYVQNDEDWWIRAKNNGVYYGDVSYHEKYDSYAVDFAFRVAGENANFLGVMRALVSLDDILSDFTDEVELLSNPNRSVVLLDDDGMVIFSSNPKYLQGTEYVANIPPEHDVGSFRLDEMLKPSVEKSMSYSEEEIRLVSFAKSTGYKSFEGFDWVVLVEQNRSSFVEEFVDLRNAILGISVIGMAVSVVIGLVISKLVTNPLKELSAMAKLISQGRFDVKAKESRISEIRVIGDSFNKMANSLQKLIETEKKLAEANTRVKNERLTAIGELAASIAHDLKNPLGTIKSSAEIVKRSRKGQDAEIDNVLDRMERAISRMSHQVEDVLNFVRVTPVNPTVTSVNKLIRSAVDSIDIPKNVQLVMPQKDTEIECDAKKIEIVLINLVLNAVQAIGQKEGRITVRVDEQMDEKEYVVISIEDTGEGIPKNMIDRIFDPLVTNKEKGTGLGLSTCKNIVEQHGGKIGVKNNPTTFSVVLPKRLQE